MAGRELGEIVRHLDEERALLTAGMSKRTVISGIPPGCNVRAGAVALMFAIHRTALHAAAIVFDDLWHSLNNIRLEGGGRVYVRDLRGIEVGISSFGPGYAGVSDGRDVAPWAPGDPDWQFFKIIVPIAFADKRRNCAGSPDDTAVDSAMLQRSGAITVQLTPFSAAAFDWEPDSFVTMRPVFKYVEVNHRYIAPTYELMSTRDQPNPRNIIVPAANLIDGYLFAHRGTGYGAPSINDDPELRVTFRANGFAVADDLHPMEYNSFANIGIYPLGLISGQIPWMTAVVFFHLEDFTTFENRKITRSPDADMKLEVYPGVVNPTNVNQFDIIQSTILSRSRH